MFDLSKFDHGELTALDLLLDKSKLNDPQLMADVFNRLVRHAVRQEMAARKPAEAA